MTSSNKWLRKSAMANCWYCCVNQPAIWKWSYSKAAWWQWLMLNDNQWLASTDVIAKMEEPQTAVLPVFNTINDTKYAVIVCGTLVYPCKAVLLNPFLSGHISHILAFLMYSAGEEVISIIHKFHRAPCQEEDNGWVHEDEDDILRCTVKVHCCVLELMSRQIL